VIKLGENIRLFEANLKKWVAAQQNFLSTLEKIERKIDENDRLEMVLETRMAFKHIMRTIKAFDKWLQDPFIIGHMPREMLIDVQRTILRITKELVKLDIKHTSEFADYILDLNREGKLNPLLVGETKKKEPEQTRLTMWR